MKTSSSIQEVINLIKTAKKDNKSIGFVPTMGALHDGHLSLVKKAKSITNFVVVSIFINPTQFNNAEDFEKYPIKTDDDIALLEQQEVDLVFLPTKETLYPKASTLKFDFGYLENIMEGALRPGHFNGVATIVSKFFNIIQPEIAFFGQKDIQQVAVIKALVDSLSYPVQIEVVETSRETSGLAMSSRNLRLTETEKTTAAEIYRSLKTISNKVQVGEDFDHYINFQIARLEKEHGFKIEYLELVKSPNLKCILSLKKGEYALCFAGQLGNVRLIDNLVFSL